MTKDFRSFHDLSNGIMTSLNSMHFKVSTEFDEFGIDASGIPLYQTPQPTDLMMIPLDGISRAVLNGCRRELNK